MSNIQSNINQILTMLGVAGRFSPNYENKIEAKNIKTAAQSAASGLKDIEENAKSGKISEYTNTQLSDVSNRVKQHNKAINDLRTAEQNSRLAKYVGNSGVAHGSEYRSMLSNIESGIEEAYKKKAMDKLAGTASSMLNQKSDFESLRSSILDKDGNNIIRGGI